MARQKQPLDNLRRHFGKGCECCAGKGWVWDKDKLGERLADLRRASGVTVAAMAAHLELSGTFVSHLETGARGAVGWTNNRIGAYLKLIGATVKDVTSPGAFYKKNPFVPRREKVKS